MNWEQIARFKGYFILLILIVISCFTLWMRLLPSSLLISENNFLLGQEPDISYNLRLIELTLTNYPQYPVVDYLTQYPYGVTILWGPMYTLIIASLCKLLGSATRLEIASIAFLVPSLMAAAMIPVIYYIGKVLADWKTGIISALFISTVSGQFVYRSLYGFADHHIAEVLFSTIFCLSYIWILSKSKDLTIRFSEPHTLKKPIFFALITGITFFLGLYTMTTMILFALIVTVFTFIQFIWDYYRNRGSEYLVVINSITFLVPTIGIFLIGINPSFSILHYSFAHVAAYLILIIGTIFLYLFSKYLKNQKLLYLPIILIISIITLILIMILLPQLFSSLMSAMQLFFGLTATTLTIQELRPWTLQEAWATYHLGFLLALGGIGFLLYQNYKEEKPANMFALIWTIIILYSTAQHVRYEYYLGPVIALLAAVCVGAIVSATWNDVWNFVTKRRKLSESESESPQTKKKSKSEKGKLARKSAFDPLKVIMFFLIAAFALIFVSVSANYNYQVGQAMGYNIMHPDWRETLEWVGNNTPDPGVDYYKIYDKETFQYPPQSYGVMSWWDYGHWITFFAKRIPHANPFQAGVAGSTGAAAYFMAPDEAQVMRISDTLGTKFVVTDIEMDTGKFWAMSTWFNETLGDRPYHQIYLVTSPDNPTTYEPVSLTTQNYYLTMISRLHNFDGSMAEPSVAYYIEYRDGTTATRYYPIVTQVDMMNATDAIQQATEYNQNALTGSHATVLSTSLTSPIEKVPALQHFRLIHESPTNVMGNSGDMRYVKAFEYVKGAHIKGEGIIEIPIVTNGGRTFTYRQESVNGEFIVPYPTEGSPYDVKATGLYRISGTNSTFMVSENAVQQGLTIT